MYLKTGWKIFLAKQDNNERMLYERPVITFMDNWRQIDKQQGKRPTLHWILTFETIKQFYGLGWNATTTEATGRLWQKGKFSWRPELTDPKGNFIFKARNPSLVYLVCWMLTSLEYLVWWNQQTTLWQRRMTLYSEVQQVASLVMFCRVHPWKPAIEHYNHKATLNN